MTSYWPKYKEYNLFSPNWEDLMLFRKLIITVICGLTLVLCLACQNDKEVKTFDPQKKMGGDLQQELQAAKREQMEAQRQMREEMQKLMIVPILEMAAQSRFLSINMMAQTPYDELNGEKKVQFAANYFSNMTFQFTEQQIPLVQAIAIENFLKDSSTFFPDELRINPRREIDELFLIKNFEKVIAKGERDLFTLSIMMDTLHARQQAYPQTISFYQILVAHMLSQQNPQITQNIGKFNYLLQLRYISFQDLVLIQSGMPAPKKPTNRDTDVRLPDPSKVTVWKMQHEKISTALIKQLTFMLKMAVQTQQDMHWLGLTPMKIPYYIAKMKKMRVELADDVESRKRAALSQFKEAKEAFDDLHQ